jgi:predicted nucleotide-binding protein
MSTSKQRYFYLTKFTPEIVLRALQELSIEQTNLQIRMRRVDVFQDVWNFDNDDEFFALYRKEEIHQALYWASESKRDKIFELEFSLSGTSIKVCMPTRAEVERVFNYIESVVRSCRLSEEQRSQQLRKWLRIFIGHGHSPVWRDLKDHLTDQHKFRVEAYETEPRAGQHIVEILNKAKKSTGFAILVMTGDNTDADGNKHARENVIHETGLFQGKLGFKRAIVLLEEDCAHFSNNSGIHYISFPKGNIGAKFGEIIATIHREFLEEDDDDEGADD